MTRDEIMELNIEQIEERSAALAVELEKAETARPLMRSRAKLMPSRKDVPLSFRKSSREKQTWQVLSTALVRLWRKGK